MHRAKTCLAALILVPAACGQSFRGASALEFTRKVVEFGPRPPGSKALERTRAYILAQLKAFGVPSSLDSFVADTPAGRLPMANIIAHIKGSSGRAVVITGHYDTKLFPAMRFVGANDAGSSTGFLLELARSVAGRPRKDDLFLVWFDGEEAIGQWSSTDGVYGSRHLAERWAREGMLGRIKALINVDMIGDRNLGILREVGSSRSLQRLVWQTAAGLGYGRYFLEQEAAVEDDHMPFVRKGVNALNLIDFDYPPWHTAEDTLDKLSATSLDIVGRVLVEVIRRLE